MSAIAGNEDDAVAAVYCCRRRCCRGRRPRARSLAGASKSAERDSVLASGASDSLAITGEAVTYLLAAQLRAFRLNPEFGWRASDLLCRHNVVNPAVGPPAIDPMKPAS